MVIQRALFRTIPFPGKTSAFSEALPLARYGGRQTITALPGDGIGPEMIDHLKSIFQIGQVPVDFEFIQLDSHQADNNLDLENAIISIERNGVAIKGNIETKIGDASLRSRNVELRVRLDLFANVLRCQTIPNVPAKHQNIDIVMIRENTEGEYSGIEHETVPGVVESLKIMTRRNMDRIARFAFEYAVKYNRKKVTAVHKANIMKIGDGLFLEVCKNMAAKYPDIKFDNMIIDNASMQLVSNPHQFDVMLMPNLYGNILSNIGCGIVGGPGLMSGINVGDKYAVFETGSRNTGTSIAGKDIANPMAFLRAGVDMLYYLGLNKHAKLIRDSVVKVISTDKMQTIDIGGSCKTSEIIETVKNDIRSKLEAMD
jgi:isocitrate dehydrogenase (NAD+)